MGENNEVLTPEEQKAEQEAMQEAKVEEVRNQIITEFGFDEVEDEVRIAKAVEKEMASRKALSQAIGQKIKNREEKEALKKALAEKEKTPSISDEDIEKKLDAKVNEKLEARDLESMPYSDELKAEIKRVAKITGVSVKQAASDPYIASKIESFEKEREAEEGAVERKHKSGGKTEFDFDNPPVIDMKDPKSIEKYEKWVEEMKKKGY